MKAIIHRILENNLNELKGLSIEGEIPLTEDILNELIGLFKDSMTTQPESHSETEPFTVSPSSSSSGDSVDISKIYNALDEKELKVELREKLAVLKISAKKFHT
jgi:hypothetical protein